VLGLVLCVFLSVFVYFVFLFVVSTGAVDCLKRLLSKMTYYVSSGTLQTLLTHSLTAFDYVVMLVVFMLLYLGQSLSFLAA